MPITIDTLLEQLNKLSSSPSEQELFVLTAYIQIHTATRNQHETEADEKITSFRDTLFSLAFTHFQNKNRQISQLINQAYLSLPKSYQNIEHVACIHYYKGHALAHLEDCLGKNTNSIDPKIIVLTGRIALEHYHKCYKKAASNNLKEIANTAMKEIGLILPQLLHDCSTLLSSSNHDQDEKSLFLEPYFQLLATFLNFIPATQTSDLSILSGMYNIDQLNRAITEHKCHNITFNAKDESEIKVFSIDADNCIFNSNVHNAISQIKMHDDTVIFSTIYNLNKKLWNLINSDSKDKNLIFMIGSNRQSYGDDKFNSEKNETPLFCKTLPIMLDSFNRDYRANTIAAAFDPLLMADANCAFGESFAKITQEINKQPTVSENNELELKHEGWIWDESKMTILYAQMHKIASDYPEKKVSFSFIDDSWEILAELAIFYRQYPQLIPSNIYLSLYHYNGDKKPRFIYQIQGKDTPQLSFFANIESLTKLLNLQQTKNSITEISDNPTLFSVWLEQIFGQDLPTSDDKLYQPR